jgi:hypothetical protein
MGVINQAQHGVHDIHLASFPKVPIHLNISVLCLQCFRFSEVLEIAKTYMLESSTLKPIPK